MNNNDLNRILKKIDLYKCQIIVDNYLYYLRKDIKDGECVIKNCEFIIVAKNKIKQAIIYNMENQDLHWYVLEKWRCKHVLSNALRTGVIKQTWPNVEAITCCCEYGENYEYKLSQTKYLAEIAGLRIKNEPTILISR